MNPIQWYETRAWHATVVSVTPESAQVAGNINLVRVRVSKLPKELRVADSKGNKYEAVGDWQSAPRVHERMYRSSPLVAGINVITVTFQPHDYDDGPEPNIEVLVEEWPPDRDAAVRNADSASEDQSK